MTLRATEGEKHMAPEDEADRPAGEDVEETGRDTSEGHGGDGDASAETGEGEPARDRVRTGLVLAVVLAFVVGALGFYQWYRLAGDDDIERAADRDAVVEAAEQHIVTLNSLDHADLDAGLQGWLDATTGTMHEDIASITEEDRDALRAFEASSSSQILALAVVDYDAVARSATVIAAVETTVRAPGADDETEERTDRYRYEADLVHTEDGWLIEALDQLPLDIGLDDEAPSSDAPLTEDDLLPEGDE